MAVPHRSRPCTRGPCRFRLRDRRGGNGTFRRHTTRASARVERKEHRHRITRKRKRLTIREVAAAVGVSVGTWSATENGLTRITEDRLTAAARLFGADRDELLRSAAPESAAASWRDFPSLQLPAPLHSALEAFVELGYHGATIRDIGARADLSVAGIYHHWPAPSGLARVPIDQNLARRETGNRSTRNGPFTIPGHSARRNDSSAAVTTPGGVTVSAISKPPNKPIERSI